MTPYFIRTHIARAVVVALVVLSFAPLASAQERRVKFARGRTSATLKGTVSSGRQVVYVLGASAGQTLVANVSTTSPNHDVVLTITGPGGVDLLGDPDTGFTGVLPDSGDYRIHVGAIESNNAPFTLEVTIR